MVDVVLIHPNGVHGIYGPLGGDLVSREQPLWPRLIAGYLLDHGKDVKIIDAECEGLSPKRVADLVAGYDPKLVCIVVSGHQPSASTQAMPGARAVAEEIRKAWAASLTHIESRRPPLVFMGNHPSALSVQTLTEEPCDYVCDGEGPLTIMGLLNGTPLNEIPGLVYWDDSRVVSNPRAPLLDVNRDLHGRAWHLLPHPSNYRSHSWQRLGDQSRRSPYAAIYTSLNCPFHCHFCMISTLFHNHVYRMRDPNLVIDEILMLNRDYGVETFKIIDELFILNRRHVKAICDGLISSGIGSKISIWCYARPDRIDKDELKTLRAAGIDWLALGIESGSEAVRDGADKHMDGQSIKQTIHDIEAAGINVIANYIVGLPSDTEESVAETVKFAKELNTAFSNWYVSMPYPGSKLYEEALEKKWEMGKSWESFSQHNEFTHPLVSGTLSAEQIVRLRDGAFKEYFSSQRYLDTITQRFGEQGRQYINKMMSYRLKRQLLPETMK